MDAFLLQVIGLVGAAVILIPFAMTQWRRLAMDSLTYQLMNAVGSGLLAAVALASWQWGFVILETIWFLVSCAGTWRVATARNRRAP